MRRREFLGAAAGALLAPSVVRAQATLAAGTQASVTTDGINLRGGAGSDQPVVGQLSSGDSVDLLGASADGAWWRVAADSGVGYVSSSFLEATGQPMSSGIFDLDLPIPYARQLTDIWCDPADLEMWLSYRQGRATTGGNLKPGQMPSSTKLLKWHPPARTSQAFSPRLFRNDNSTHNRTFSAV